MADPIFHDSSPDATSPNDLPVDPRDVELPSASNRQIAKTLGVDERTVRRDTAANAAPSEQKTEQHQQATAANAAPALSGSDPVQNTLSGAEAAIAAQNVVEREQRRKNKENRPPSGGLAYYLSTKGARNMDAEQFIDDKIARNERGEFTPWDIVCGMEEPLYDIRDLAGH